MISVEKPGTPSELVHVGVRGMHWGVRKREEISSKTSSTTAKKPSFVRQHKKEILIGAGVAAGILAAYGTYKLADSGQARQLLDRRPLKANALLGHKMSSDRILSEVVKPINPHFGDIGTKMNCRRATFAYEMRRRGLDVVSTNSIGGSGQTKGSLLRVLDPTNKMSGGKVSSTMAYLNEGESGPVHDFFKSGSLGRQSIGKGMLPHMEAREKSQWIFDQIAKHGEGARGELGVQWVMGGHHSMAWENINGIPHVFDAQSGRAFDANTFTNVAHGVSAAGMTRLDNIDLNTKFLRRWVRNV